MNRLVLLSLLALLTSMPPTALVAADWLTPAEAASELKILHRALLDLHPGLYRYQTADALDRLFTDARSQVDNGATAARMYLLVSRIAASVRCGHTWTNPLNQGDVMQSYLAKLPVLPVRVRQLQGRLLVSASTDPAIERFDEILAINGQATGELIAGLMPYLRADGGSDGKRLSQLDSTPDGGALDRLLPLLNPPVDGVYELRLRSPMAEVRTARVRGVTVSDRERALTQAGRSPESDEWRFVIDGDTATLTLPTFSFWRSDFDWRGFLASSFESLAVRKTPKLIIDLRQNEGGDDAIGQALLSYLIDAAHVIPAGRVESAYERVPYDLARFLDTWSFDFFDRTGAVDRGEGRNWRLLQQPDDQIVAPMAPHFAGRVAVLIGPRMSSAGFLVARDIRLSAAGFLVGQPTGGNQRGLNGGELAWLTLPHSGVAIDIPLLATFHDDKPDAGIAPDLDVITRVEDVIAGRDPDRTAALAWLDRRP